MIEVSTLSFLLRLFEKVGTFAVTGYAQVMRDTEADFESRIATMERGLQEKRGEFQVLLSAPDLHDHDFFCATRLTNRADMRCDVRLHPSLRATTPQAVELADGALTTRGHHVHRIAIHLYAD